MIALLVGQSEIRLHICPTLTQRLHMVESGPELPLSPDRHTCFSGSHRLIESSVVNDHLLPIGNVRPANEAVSRELLHLKEPELITQAWQEAVDTAPVENGEAIVTAKHVKGVIGR